MTRAVLVLLALTLLTPATLSQQLPPPQNPAAEDTEALPPGPDLFAPQNAPQAAAPHAEAGAPAEPAKKNVSKPPEFFAALRRAERERKQARIERMKQFQAARTAEQQKLYQDWHERYMADTPVRVEYYRALATAYASQPAVAYYGPPIVVASPVILPVTYAPVVYSPLYQPPVYYGTVISWRW